MTQITQMEAGKPCTTGYDVDAPLSWSSRQERPRLGAAEGGSSAPERYEILGELGQGGMSVVFRARDKQLGRDVAVKVLHDFLARQPDARKRFHREAVAVARLRHPGIVEIHDYSGPDAEDAYIVCELIEGHTLRALVDEHGVPPHPELAVLVIAELVRALRHAHEQGIVHRDVKPENVMITPAGLLKLMDFGIAQIMEGATKLTATGTLLGSPAHMAPEVIDGKPSDHRSDIFSVGTMLYWLATGELPFQAPNPSALFRRILEGTYEPCQMLNPKIGNGLARVIDHALAPDPEARYQDVSELQADLQKELEEVGLVPADSLVKRYLADPRGFAEEVRPKIVEALVAKGNQAIEDGNVARAMDRFNRVLAIDPEHPEVARRVSLIGRRERFNRRARRAAVALAVAAGVAGVAGAGVAYWPEAHEAPAPVATKPPAMAATPAMAALAPGADTTPGAGPEASEAPAAEAPAVGSAAPGPVRPARPGPATEPRFRAVTRGAPAPRGVTVTPVVATPTPRETLPTPAEAAVAEPAPKQATLRVRIGNGWGNIRINGKLERSGVFDGAFKLAPGRHMVEVFRPDGRHRPRTIEVDDEGNLFEVGAGGARADLVGGELLFRMPSRGGTEPGWIPAESEATASPQPERGG